MGNCCLPHGITSVSVRYQHMARLIVMALLPCQLYNKGTGCLPWRLVVLCWLLTLQTGSQVSVSFVQQWCWMIKCNVCTCCISAAVYILLSQSHKCQIEMTLNSSFCVRGFFNDLFSEPAFVDLAGCDNVVSCGIFLVCLILKCCWVSHNWHVFTQLGRLPVSHYRKHPLLQAAKGK